MKKMMSAYAVVACLLTGTAQAQAQTFNDLQIRLGGFTVSPDGGEKPMGIWYSTGPVMIGKSATSTWSWDGVSCEGWSVSSRADEFRDDATTAWRIEITPVRVAGDAVTFRLRWIRFTGLKQQTNQFSFDRNVRGGGPADVELTLRPGESTSVDEVRIPDGAKTVHGRLCGGSSSIRVTVDPYPSDFEERRLVSTELWLVERLANGSEAQRSQPLTLRALPNHPFPFYFDRTVDQNIALYVSGKLTVHLAENTIGVALDSRFQLENPARPRGTWSGLTSTLQLKPAETVEIQLPPFDDTGPFANRKFSIKIRVRQLR